MHHLKHLRLWPRPQAGLQTLKQRLSVLSLLMLLLYSSCLVDCKTLNDYASYANYTNLSENFKYDPATLHHLASNSITSFELLKNNGNADGNPVNCGCPPKGQYSHSTLNAEENVPCLFKLNDEIKYACKSGYIKASGSEKLTCQLGSNGKAEWSGKPLNCKIITCADPGEVAHATRIVKDPNFSYNSQVSYQCNSNYMSDSKPVMLCDRNGQWNRKKPVCKLIQCPHLPQLSPILFFNYSDAERKVNSTVSFHCSEGYHLDDKKNAYRQCEWNGNWTGSNPTCLLNYCEVPDDLAEELNVKPAKDRYERGERISYRCKSVNKKMWSDCGLDGKFNPPLPTECLKPRKTHCPPVELQHGQVNSSAQDEFVIGASLSFRCDENYILSEQNVLIHCLWHGEWSGPPPRCLDLATIRTSQILSYILTCIIIILILIVAITVVMLFRWRRKQLQKRQWQRYFCNLEYQNCDKTKVQGNTGQEMHIFQAQRISVPFTDL